MFSSQERAQKLLKQLGALSTELTQFLEKDMELEAIGEVQRRMRMSVDLETGRSCWFFLGREACGALAWGELPLFGGCATTGTMRRRG